MIWNIVDHRKRKFRWREINAVIEDIRNDHNVADTDDFDDENDLAPVYDARRNILLHDAIHWTEKQEGKVTLYLYDQGAGIRLVPGDDRVSATRIHDELV
jgi:hypothetical protein